MRLYAISDRRLFRGGELERRAALVKQAVEWSRAGVEWVQLREKDLGAEELEALARRVVSAVRQAEMGTRVVVNGLAVPRARAAGADGVHLAGGWTRAEVVEVLASGAVSVACHSLAEVKEAREAGVSVAVFAPVFEKPLAGGESLEGVGLNALREVCAGAGELPVFALGGVTAVNARKCVEAGSAGVAGIRLFAGEGWRGLAADG